MTPFLALPKKHLPRAQVIFVVQAGRKFRLFSLTLQRYKKFKALPNYSSKKARKKARSDFESQKVVQMADGSFLTSTIPPRNINFTLYIIYILYIE